MTIPQLTRRRPEWLARYYELPEVENVHNRAPAARSAADEIGCRYRPNPSGLISAAFLRTQCSGRQVAKQWPSWMREASIKALS